MNCIDYFLNHLSYNLTAEQAINLCKDMDSYCASEDSHQCQYTLAQNNNKTPWFTGKDTSTGFGPRSETMENVIEMGSTGGIDTPWEHALYSAGFCNPTPNIGDAMCRQIVSNQIGDDTVQEYRIPKNDVNSVLIPGWKSTIGTNVCSDQIKECE